MRYLLLALLALALLTLLLDFMGGCGEVFINHAGESVPGECTGRLILLDLWRML